jgi:hypothetical protein
MIDDGQAVIVGAEIVAGHDGQAEMVVRVRHENGVVAPVVLDGRTGFRLMANQGADDLTALIGRPWRDLLRQTLLAGTGLTGASLDDDNDGLEGLNDV